MAGANADACSQFLARQGWSIVIEYDQEGREIRTHVEPGCVTDNWRLPIQSEVAALEDEKSNTKKTSVSPLILDSEVVLAIRMYRLSKSLLESLGVLRNQKDFTSQLGEYVALEMFGGELAESGIQEGWDLIDGNDKKVQVKSHAKAESNVVRSTPFKYQERKFDDLCIVRFTPNYADVIIHRLSFEKALDLVSSGTISWSLLSDEMLVYQGVLCAEIKS